MSTTSAVHVEFRQSLPVTLILDAAFVAIAEQYEGFDSWVYSVHTSMPADLRDEIEWLFDPFGAAILIPHAITAPPSENTIAAVIRWLGQIDNQALSKDLDAICQKLLDHLPNEARPPFVDRSDAASLKEFLRRLADESVIPAKGVEHLARLLKDLDEFKAAVTYALSRFWDRYVKDEYSHCQSMQEQSVNHYKQAPPSGTAEEIFLEVCGRAYPKSHGPSLEQVQKIWFIPSCHCGPYVSITDAEGDGTLLVIVYNCRPSAESPRQSTLPVDDMVRPLKALADETRLEILALLLDRELYAQQIVQQLQISQSAVSRHLRLMVACDVLHVRKQEGMKFYSINEGTLGSLIQQLEFLRNKNA